MRNVGSKYVVIEYLLPQSIVVMMDKIPNIAILNDFLCISVLMNFGEIKFMFLGEKLKQKFDNLKRPT